MSAPAPASGSEADSASASGSGSDALSSHADSSAAEYLDAESDGDDDFARVDAAQLARVQRINARHGLPPSAPSCVGATPPRPEEGETEEQFDASTAPRPGGFRMVAPRITLEQARAKARQCAAAQQAPPPPRCVALVDPEWRAQVLECVHEQGFELAPPGFPLEAAFTMRPDIGLAWIIAGMDADTAAGPVAVPGAASPSV